MLIGYWSPKGGTGKTTLSVCHAGWLTEKGYSVGFLDADRQKLSSQWLSKAQLNVQVRDAATPSEVQKQLNALLAKHDFVIADGPGGFDKQNVVLVKRANLCIIPALASPLDIHSSYANAKPFLNAVARRSSTDRLIRFVLNGVDDRTGIAKDVRSFARRMDPRAAKAVVRRLTNITACFPNRLPHAREAKRDLDRLFTELTNLIQKGRPKRRVSNE